MKSEVCLAASSALRADWTPAELPVGFKAVLKVIFCFSLSVRASSHQSHGEAHGEDGGRRSRRRPGGHALLLQGQDGQPCAHTALHQGEPTETHAGYISQANRCSTLKVFVTSRAKQPNVKMVEFKTDAVSKSCVPL